MVSLFQKAKEEQIPLPMAAAQLRRRDAARTRAASDQTVARLSSETIRWYQIPSGLSGEDDHRGGCKRAPEIEPPRQHVHQGAAGQGRNPHQLAADHDRSGVPAEPVSCGRPSCDGGPAQERVVPEVRVVGQVMGVDHGPGPVYVRALVVVSAAGITLKIPAHRRARDGQ